MILPVFQGRIDGVLARLRGSPWLAPFAGGLAFAATFTMSLPFTTILAPAVLIAPRRWRAIAVTSAVGSALGATLLVLAFHELGWAQIHAAFPAMLENAQWMRVIAWTEKWGLLALAVVALSPLPQTPALVFCAISAQSLVGVFVAMLVGKLVKYGVLAALVARFPAAMAARLGRSPSVGAANGAARRA